MIIWIRMKLVLIWYLATILNFKMAVLNVYNPAYLTIYLRQKHENWQTYTLWHIVSYETESGYVPDSSEPYASGRLRVGLAYTLLTTDPTRTVRVRFAVYTLRLLCDRLWPNYMYLTRGIYHVFRVMNLRRCVMIVRGRKQDAACGGPAGRHHWIS